MTLTPTVLHEYDRNAPSDEKTESLTFGIGCFWGPDAEFGALDGVVRTRVGYAGGMKPDPSYHSLGDHTEVLQVEFDPSVISTEEILQKVFTGHNPRHQTGKRQYHNVVLPATEKQASAVDAYLDGSDFDPETVETRIETLSKFYPAEDYHQKYNLRSKRWVMDAFEEAEYSDEQIRESPAAAKLNAHVSGHDVAVPFLDARNRSE